MLMNEEFVKIVLFYEFIDSLMSVEYFKITTIHGLISKMMREQQSKYNMFCFFETYEDPHIKLFSDLTSKPTLQTQFKDYNFDFL